MNDEMFTLPQTQNETAVEEPVLQRRAGRRRRVRGLPLKFRLALALGLCVAMVLCRIAWPAGASTLRRWIVGDGSEQVQQAFFRMEQALEEGDGLGEAWEAFCGELTDAPA